MIRTVLGFVAVGLFTLSAHAQGQHTGPNAAWFNKQYNHSGQWCCDVSDGHEFDGDYVVNPDGSVTLSLNDGVKRTLPKEMILSGPNPTGHAVWWFVEGPGYHTDFCFAPGAGI